jgi:DNA/RNA endonuclease G (NUC1)
MFRTTGYTRALFAFVLVLAACRKEEAAAPAPAPPPKPEVDDGRDDHLALGNPSNATTDAAFPENYLVRKAQYALAYTNSRGTARWVAWHHSTARMGNAERCDCFQPDWALPFTFFQANTWDYTNTGFDRGHLCPSADRDASDADNAATFLMTNIMPQAPQLGYQLGFDEGFGSGHATFRRSPDRTPVSI